MLRRRPTPMHARLRSAGGFTTIELLIVCAIIAALIAIAIPSFKAVKESSTKNSEIAAAFVYQKAVEAYRVDHSGAVPPAVGDATAWPTASIGPVSSSGNPYVAGGAPELVGDQVVTVMGPSGTPTTAIVYRSQVGATGPDLTSYVITVYWKGQGLCQISDAALGTSPNPPACKTN
jgi:type II secretory pathway pseudopilin PulG